KYLGSNPIAAATSGEQCYTRTPQSFTIRNRKNSKITNSAKGPETKSVPEQSEPQSRSKSSHASQQLGDMQGKGAQAFFRDGKAPTLQSGGNQLVSNFTRTGHGN